MVMNSGVLSAGYFLKLASRPQRRLGLLTWPTPAAIMTKIAEPLIQPHCRGRPISVHHPIRSASPQSSLQTVRSTRQANTCSITVCLRPARPQL